MIPLMLHTLWLQVHTRPGNCAEGAAVDAYADAWSCCKDWCFAAEIRASDIGTRAGLFEVQKIGDEFFTFVVDCDKPKACSIVLRGASKVCKTTSFSILQPQVASFRVNTDFMVLMLIARHAMPGQLWKVLPYSRQHFSAFW